METVTLYHGTSTSRIEAEGLRNQVGDFGRLGSVFVTDSLRAATDYAELAARIRGGEPVVLAVTLPAMRTQPNGTCAPPFCEDDWHTDSGMPGTAWEYDAPIGPERIRRLD